MLDELVVEVMGVPVPDTVDKRIKAAQQVTTGIRREGRRNLAALRRIQDATATKELRLSLVRLLDIALWFSHPAAGVAAMRREIVVAARRSAGPS